MHQHIVHALPERHVRIVVERKVRHVGVVIVAAQDFGGVGGIVERRRPNHGRIVEAAQKAEQTWSQRVVVDYEVEREVGGIGQQFLDTLRAQATWTNILCVFMHIHLI